MNAIAGSGSDGEELPALVDSLECVLSAVVELEACSGDQHRHSGGDEEFAGRGGIEHASGDVDCDTGDVGAPDLDFARMQAGADLEAEGPEGVAQCDCAADRSTGTIES